MPSRELLRLADTVSLDGRPCFCRGYDRHGAHELDFWFGTRILGWMRAVKVMDKELNAVPIWVVVAC